MGICVAIDGSGGYVKSRRLTTEGLTAEKVTNVGQS